MIIIVRKLINLILFFHLLVRICDYVRTSKRAKPPTAINATTTTNIYWPFDHCTYIHSNAMRCTLYIYIHTMNYEYAVWFCLVIHLLAIIQQTYTLICQSAWLWWSWKKIEQERDTARSSKNYCFSLFHNRKFQWKAKYGNAPKGNMKRFSYLLLLLLFRFVHATGCVRDSVLRFNAMHMWWMEVNSSLAFLFISHRCAFVLVFFAILHSMKSFESFPFHKYLFINATQCNV